MGISVYLVHGSDGYKVHECVQGLLDKLVPESEREFGLEMIDGAATSADAAIAVIRQATEAIRTGSFLGNSKTVWVKNATFLAPRRKDDDDDDDASSEPESANVDDGSAVSLKTMLDYLAKVITEEIPEGHTLILSAADVSASLGIVKTLSALEKKGTAKIMAFEALDASKKYSDDEAIALAQKEAKRQGKTLPEETAAAFIARIGTNSHAIVSELDKLLTYCADRAPTPEDVLAIVSLGRESQAWDILDAFGERNLPKAVQILHHLLEADVAPIFLVMQLTTRVNDLLIIQDSLQRRFATAGGGGFRWQENPDIQESVSDLQKRFNPASKHSFVVSRLLRQATNFKRIELRRARQVFMNAHERIVSVGVAPEALLELALINALQQPPC